MKILPYCFAFLLTCCILLQRALLLLIITCNCELLQCLPRIIIFFHCISIYWRTSQILFLSIFSNFLENLFLRYLFKTGVAVSPIHQQVKFRSQALRLVCKIEDNMRVSKTINNKEQMTIQFNLGLINLQLFIKLNLELPDCEHFSEGLFDV